MSRLTYLGTLLRITFKRFRTQPGITLASLFGLTVAVTLMEIVPLYADAVNFRILEEELTSLGERPRPPWSYIYTYVGNWHGDVEWETIRPVHEYLSAEAPDTLGLPLRLMVRHVETAPFRLFPTDETNYSGDRDLGFAALATTTGIESHIELLEGEWPSIPNRSNDPVELLIPQSFATEAGWQVNEEYLMLNVGRTASGSNFTIRIAGIWRPLDPGTDFWFNGPNAYDDLFVVPEETFASIVAPALGDEVNFALWYLVMDGSAVGTADIDRLVAGAAAVEQTVDVLLPNASPFVTPTNNLNFYRQAVGELSLLLFSINLPTISMALAFIGLVAHLGISRQRNEIAITRSRGGSRLYIFGLSLVEGILLGLIAFALGTVAAVWLTPLLGQARSFLDFSGEGAVRMNLTRQAINAGLATIVIALVARTIPAIGAAQHTIITYKQDQARTLSVPWWQRGGIDFILLGIATYGFFLLRQQGGIATNSDNPAAGSDLFQNPLLLLLPALSLLAITLFFIRLLPPFMGLLSRLVTPTPSISLLQAIRYLARTPRHYVIPLGLLILTVGLAVFTASLARTVDLQLFDETFYRVGADVSLITVPPSASGFGPQSDTDELLFTFLPVSAYQRLPHIEQATRVGNYELSGQVDGRPFSGRFVGIDPAQFHKIAYWRDDFSRYRFGSLMNGLGQHADGVLVPNSLLENSTLQVGDPIRYTLSLGGGEVEYGAVVIGSFDYFPTWYPAEDGILIVGNLTHLFEVAGGEFLYQVWAESESQIETEPFRQALIEQQMFGTYWDEARPRVADAQNRPERQGLFGLLSVGFITSSFLTVLGFLLYGFFSLQRRTVELGILRAVGLSRANMIGLVAWELILLILSGMLLGTTVGVLISRQFIPFLQITGTDTQIAPPYLVEIAWDAVTQVYLLFGLLFIIAFTTLSWRLLHIKLFQAIKLGETI